MGPKRSWLPHRETRRGAGRGVAASTRLPAAVLLALAGLAGCGRDGGARAAGAGPAAGTPSRGVDSGAEPVAEVVRAARPGRPVVFVGLDGADWELLDEYMSAGAMPELAALVAEGRSGVLETEQPPLSPLVWTTMMTGVGPLAHGVLDFTRFNPATGVREPITRAERRVPAVWNMATQGGRRVAVFGLWATWPAEPVAGLVVSDRLFAFQHRQESPPPGIVYPPAEETWAREALAAAEREVDLAALREYLPDLGETEYAEALSGPDPYARPVSALRRILVETAVYHRLATDWIGRERPDLAVVYFQGTDAIGHVFAPYAPPRQPAIPAADYQHYHRVPERYFRRVDRLLGDYRRLAAARGAVLVVASDHGFSWHEGRPEGLSSLAAATAGQWHREEGIYLLWGPGITPAAASAAGGERRERGEVAQVCTTLLALLGLPPAAGGVGPPLPGTPVDPSGETVRPVDYRAHYAPAAVAGEGAASGPAPGAAEELAKLRALGYVGGGEPTAAPAGRPDAADPTRTPASFNNEGLILEAAGRRAEAVAAFERALALDPGLASAAWNLSDLLYADGRGEPGDLDRADALLVRALEAGQPGGDRQAVARARAYRDSGRLDRAVRLLAAAAAARPEAAEVRLFLGRFRVEAGDCAGALADFDAVASSLPGNAVALASRALARLCLGDRAGGAADLRRSLELDPDQPQVRAALAGLE